MTLLILMIFVFMLLDVTDGFVSVHFYCSVLFGFGEYYHIWLWQQCLNSDGQQIPPISTKRTITSHLKQLNIKENWRHMVWGNQVLTRGLFPMLYSMHILYTLVWLRMRALGRRYYLMVKRCIEIGHIVGYSPSDRTSQCVYVANRLHNGWLVWDLNECHLVDLGRENKHLFVFLSIKRHW